MILKELYVKIDTKEELADFGETLLRKKIVASHGLRYDILNVMNDDRIVFNSSTTLYLGFGKEYRYDFGPELYYDSPRDEDRIYNVKDIFDIDVDESNKLFIVTTQGQIDNGAIERIVVI